MSVYNKPNRTSRISSSAVLKVIYCFLLIFFLVPWFISLMMVLNGARDGWHLPTLDLFFYFFPAVYFPYCFVSSTRFLRGQALIISGIAMHIGLAVWAFIAWTTIIAFVFILLTLLWATLCVIRINLEQEFS
jgi:hypothetical protein